MRDYLIDEERDGFAVKAWAEPDQDADLSWLGKFQSNRCCRACIDRKKAGTWSRGEFEFFHPENPEHQYQRADWREAEAFANGEKGMYVVFVTASREGVELGRAILGNVDDSYLRGAIDEGGMVAEAIREATATLGKLCPSAQGDAS